MDRAAAQDAPVMAKYLASVDDEESTFYTLNEFKA